MKSLNLAVQASPSLAFAPVPDRWYSGNGVVLLVCGSTRVLTVSVHLGLSGVDERVENLGDSPLLSNPERDRLSRQELFSCVDHILFGVILKGEREGKPPPILDLEM